MEIKCGDLVEFVLDDGSVGHVFVVYDNVLDLDGPLPLDPDAAKEIGKDSVPFYNVVPVIKRRLTDEMYDDTISISVNGEDFTILCGWHSLLAHVPPYCILKSRFPLPDEVYAQALPVYRLPIDGGSQAFYETHSRYPVESHGDVDVFSKISGLVWGLLDDDDDEEEDEA